VIHLANVPKVVEIIKSEWAKEMFLITFKLETDVEILDKKMNIHLYKYNVDLVVGNVLGTHSDIVRIRQKETDNFIVERTQEEKDDHRPLEAKIIPILSSRHNEYILN